ncbi:MAG: GMC oxidoreductase [Rubripirellula sp.]
MTSRTRRDVLRATVASVIGATAAESKADFTPLRSLPVVVKRATSYKSGFKKRAIADYAANMRPFGGALSQHGRHLLHQPVRQNTACDFDVVIIGSGYGASICAARLAQAKRDNVRIAVLERGREWIPGTFGDTFLQTSRESRFQMLGPKKGEIDNPVGLVNVMQNDEVNVLSGSGLGGSSLINANVAIQPDQDCFNQTKWPQALRDRVVLEPYYDLASQELGVQPEKEDASPKAKSQRLAAEKLTSCGAHFESASLTITRGAPDEAIVNRQGLLQRPCIDCGDCNSGCNVGAKNTLAMNYLPVARRHGAELYTHTEVVRVEKLDGHYRIHFKNYLPSRHGKYKAVCGSISSRIVILGAGSIGSSEILLRSQGCGMELSQRVGHQWTMNGDALGFVRKSQYLTGSAGLGAYGRKGLPVGPTIQTNLTYPERELAKRILIQDGTVTRAYANILGALMVDLDFDSTLIMLGMGHDGANGRVTLGKDGLGSVKWPGLMKSPYRKLIRSEFAKVAKAHGGEYKYLRLFGDNFITVHPLGGCAMADDPNDGVVDDRGRVFDGRFGGMVEASNSPQLLGVASGAAVHQGLYVADGSVIPTSIGCNPLLTISALSERIADGILSNPVYGDLFGPIRNVA